jgi:hypothetical protein
MEAASNIVRRGTTARLAHALFRCGVLRCSRRIKVAKMEVRVEPLAGRVVEWQTLGT